MSIYMTIADVTGSVSRTGHEGAIQLESVEGMLTRYIDSVAPGHCNDRDLSLPIHSEITITKSPDSSFIPLYKAAHDGHVYPLVKIDFTRTGKQQAESYMTYELSNVLIGGYRILTEGAHPLEVIQLNYTQIEKRFISSNANHSVGTPSSMLYNLETGVAS